MQISPLSNNRLTFGYNKQFHKNIQQELLKRKSPKADMLVQRDKILVKQEKKILFMENLGLAGTLKYREMCNSLTQQKVQLAKDIDKYLIDLKYSKNTSQTYRIEASRADCTDKEIWRRNLGVLLERVWLEEKDEAQKAIYETLEKVTEKTSSEYEQSSKNNDTGADSLIPLYTANEHSPKGPFDVIGSKEIKEKLNDDFIPYAIPSEQLQKDYQEYGLRAPRGFLFYGPPGCGKTFMAQALTAETGMKMYMLDVSKAGSSYINKTAINVRNAFEYVFNKAKKSEKPVIIFMDEVDSLAANRSSSTSGSQEDSKAVTTLLKMVEEARDNNVIVIAATNRYDILDSAFKDRFDGQIYFPLPDEEQIENLLTGSLLSREKGLELGYEEEKIKELSKMLKGFSNRAIIQIVDDSAKIARRRSRDSIKFEDVKQELKQQIMQELKKIYIQEAKSPKIGFLPSK